MTFIRASYTTSTYFKIPDNIDGVGALPIGKAGTTSIDDADNLSYYVKWNKLYILTQDGLTLEIEGLQEEPDFKYPDSTKLLNDDEVPFDEDDFDDDEDDL